MDSVPADARVLLSWSSGKDSAWALHELRRRHIKVVGLLTTLNMAARRVAMHAVRQSLLRQQAAAADLPLIEVALPWPCDNATYEARVTEALEQNCAELGVTHMAFGDLFLEDVRAYRERQVEEAGLMPLFPLWGKDTRELATEMIAGGLQARITCVDPRQIDGGFAGRDFDSGFLQDLPETADPCGEQGEFHSFVFAGPMFSEPVAVRSGVIAERDGFVYADVLPHTEGD